MNAFDYFFEKTSAMEKFFLVGKDNLSFKELYISSSRLASWLRKEYGTNKNILLLSVNNRFFLTAYFAIIKSGNVCIPLDPNIEKENLEYITGLTNPVLIFMTRDIEKKISAGTVKCIFPDTIGQDEFSGPLSGKEENFDREACAEIIFTSGSTGIPKGVMISHKNLITNTDSIVTYLKLNQNDRMLVVLPFYYCYGLSLLHTHLRVGGSIVLNNSFIFLGSIINNLLEYKCTGFAGVPSHFQILLRKSDNFKTTKFPDLRYVTQAGGKLAPIFIDEFRNSHPEITFIVMYGQTEATARLSYLPPDLYEAKKGSMGKGIPGVELRVIDEKGEKIKPGEVGEVIAKGDNVMIGYFKDEEGTKNAIRDGWLYTGDLGTVDKDGYIFLTARKKEIIKVGGKRISPKEIEAVILELPEVVDCTIEGVEDELLGEALKATVVIRTDNGKEMMVDKIKQHCSRHLALYKVPQLFELKEQLVISATGKKIKGKL
ncbi:MAG TPA: AMP-dependent synthetase [Bacteroidales bacterium]|nr:AMP-dependent synthetase [Bacteroidales bacterium]